MDLIFFLTNKVFFKIFLNKYDFSFERRHIHVANLFRLIFVKCSSCEFNISSNIMQKMIYWSLESRRPDSVWAEWVLNTFPFHNLALELRNFG